MMNWIFFAGNPLGAAETPRGARNREAPIPAQTNSRRETLTMLDPGAARDISPERSCKARANLVRCVRFESKLDATEEFPATKHHILLKARKTFTSCPAVRNRRCVCNC